MLQDKFREMCYAVDKDGKYVTVLSTGWSPKNAAMKQAWEEIYLKADKARQDILDGKKSILAFHMEMKIMNIKLLSLYTGIPRRKIRKHLKPDHFAKLDGETLERYADAFGISVAEMTDHSKLERPNEQNKH